MGLLRTSFWRSWLGRTWKITLAFTNAWPRLTPFYQVGQAQPCCFGQGKLYHLRTEEIKQLGSILAYESPHTGAPADYAKAVQLLQVWKVRMLRCGSLRERRPRSCASRGSNWHARGGSKAIRSRCALIRRAGHLQSGASAGRNAGGNMYRPLVVTRQLPKGKRAECLRAGNG